jgi:hypothetical protein
MLKFKSEKHEEQFNVVYAAKAAKAGEISEPFMVTFHGYEYPGFQIVYRNHVQEVWAIDEDGNVFSL